MSEVAHTADGQAGAVLVLHERAASFDPHPETSHTEHVLTYLVDGWISMDSGGPFRAEAGSMMIVPAGIPHRDLSGSNAEYWWVGFCATCLGLDEGQPLMQPYRSVRHGAVPVVSIASGRRSRVVRLFRELREESQRVAPESPELSRSLLTLLLGELRRGMPGETSDAAAGSLVGSALEFIQRHSLEPISLEDVAAAVHRTPSHVAATVKKATGHSVGAWIRASRVAEAAARLSHTDDSLDEIAARVGWQDKTHFIRQFRKVYGQTPAAWRREQRAGHGRR